MPSCDIRVLMVPTKSQDPRRRSCGGLRSGSPRFGGGPSSSAEDLLADFQRRLNVPGVDAVMGDEPHAAGTHVVAEQTAPGARVRELRRGHVFEFEVDEVGLYAAQVTPQSRQLRQAFGQRTGVGVIL